MAQEDGSRKDTLISINANTVMVEVFKTNVREAYDAQQIVQKLLEHFPESKINFDLEDCDKILRIEAQQLDLGKILDLVNRENFVCEVLE